MTLTQQDRKQYDCNHDWIIVGGTIRRCNKCEAQTSIKPTRCKWCGEKVPLTWGRMNRVWGYYCTYCLTCTVV